MVDQVAIVVILGVALAVMFRVSPHSQSLAYDFLNHPVGKRILLPALGLVYYVPLESIWGRTAGKLLFGTRVVDRREDAPPSLGRTVLRTLGRSIPLEFFSIFFARGMWHDRLGQTQVVSLRHGPPSKVADSGTQASRAQS